VEKSCEEIKRLVPKADQLREREREALETHLNSCKRCGTLAAQYCALINEGRNLEAPVDFGAVWSHIAEEINQAEQSPGIAKKTYKWLLLLPAAAAAIVVVAVLSPGVKPREVEHPLSVAEMEMILEGAAQFQAGVDDVTEMVDNTPLSGLDTSNDCSSLKLAGISDADSRSYPVDMF
jgi:hypothetical protein